jgi:hypothetical protein
MAWIASIRDRTAFDLFAQIAQLTLSCGLLDGYFCHEISDRVTSEVKDAPYRRPTDNSADNSFAELKFSQTWIAQS